MDENAKHPSQRPNPERVAKWRAEIEHQREQITTLVMFRDDFALFDKVVRANDRIVYAESPFPGRVKQWYVDSQVMRIRRILEPKTERNDVHSLRQLLEDMRRACAAFTRDNIDELFDAEDAPEYDAEVRDFLVSSMWDDAGDIVNDEDRLYSKHIKEHLSELLDASGAIIRYADRIVAHDTVIGLEESALPGFSAISMCVDAIERVARHYIATLTGAGYMSLSPVSMYSRTDVFRFAWMTPAAYIL